MKKFWKVISSFLSNLFFPRKLKCIFCGKDIPNFEEKPYCDICEKELSFNNGHKCKICDMEIPTNGDVCDLCKTNHKHFDKACAIFKYEGKVRSTILKLKNDNGKYLTEPMAFLMANGLHEDMKNFDIIIPVPLSEKSFKKRGYNQSLLLAKEISRLTNKPVVENLLIKTKETKPQKELSYKDRQKNLENAFSLTSRKKLKDKTVLLIDDVMTTSATADACASVMKKHCKKVFVLVFARNTIKFDKNLQVK